MKTSIQDGLTQVLAKLAPKASQYHAQHGCWPSRRRSIDEQRPPAERIAEWVAALRAKGFQPEEAADRAKARDAAERCAPYVITTREDGSVLVTVHTDDGESVAASGKTLADAVSALAAKGGA